MRGPWSEHRAALALYLQPDQFTMLNTTVRAMALSTTGAVRAQAVDDLLAWLVSRARGLRPAHQAFILTPLLKYLASSPWRRKDPDATQLPFITAVVGDTG